MESYSVKQIAEMLNTQPETVRRWIRNGKLNEHASVLGTIGKNKNREHREIRYKKHGMKRRY